MNKLRVLIVDDSARTISLIKDSLSEDTEVEIVGQAENGVEAIEMIRETKPDVVFLDLIMPKMDGLLVLEKVCQGLPGIEKRPKFIVVTAVTQENVMQTAFQYGAAYYVLKPGSLTLRLPLDFHNSLHHSPLRLIFLSNFKILLVIVCHCVV